MKLGVLKKVGVFILAMSLVACTNSKEVKVEEFNAVYEVAGKSYTGSYVDTFTFEGETSDGIITKLNFDIIRVTEAGDEYSKKDLMGYLMNISDASLTVGETNSLKITSYGYDENYGEGSAAQFMASAMTDNLTNETTMKELTFINDAQSFGGTTVELELEKALIAFSYVAKENGVENFSEDTLVVDLLGKHGLYVDGELVAGEGRISFEGFNGGRSYGEQIDAIVAYILASEMTLEEVYTLFTTENQPGTAVADRDLVTGATITFVGTFQRVAYLAAYGELFEGATGHTQKDEQVVVTVITQGYGGDITSNITFNTDGTIVSIDATQSHETDGIGAELTAAESEFIQALIAGQEDVDGVDVVTGATQTSNALKKAVTLAKKYIEELE